MIDGYTECVAVYDKSSYSAEKERPLREHGRYMVREDGKVRLEPLYEILNGSRYEGLEGEDFQTLMVLFKGDVMRMSVSLVVENGLLNSKWLSSH